MTVENVSGITHEIADISVVLAQKEKLLKMPLIKELIDSFAGNFVVLNKNRQIVVSNKAFAEYSGKTDATELTGLRIGSALRCRHSEELATGCGSTAECSTCGAFNSIIESINSKPAKEECRVLCYDGEALDFRIATTPLAYGDEMFILASMADISHEKRRLALESIFFHDILNTAGNLRGMSELLMEASGEEAEELKVILHDLSERLIEEIMAQKDLSAAENGELAVNNTTVSALSLIYHVMQSFKASNASKSGNLLLYPFSHDLDITTDPVVLGRVLSNMIKNALEASYNTETVTVGCELNMGSVQFWVHNPDFMKKASQYQIFNRSFTTKGTGRGLGTYSMKLLTEKYLKGKIEFTSTEGEGTKFTITLPINEREKLKNYE